MSWRNKLILPILLFVATVARAQTPILSGRSSSAVIPVDTNEWVKRSHKIPVFIDTTHALAAAGIDSIGLLFKESQSSRMWVRDSNYVGGHKWTQIGTTGSTGNPNIFISNGARGDTTYVDGISGTNTIKVAGRVDSGDFHTYENGDSTRTSYVNAHDTTSADALQSKYRSDTSRAAIYAALAGKQATGNYITILTGDVGAAGPGSASATVKGIQGIAVSATSPSTGQVQQFNGSQYAPATIIPDSGLAVLYAPLSGVPLARVIQSGKRLILYDTLRGSNSAAIVTAAQLQKVLDSLNLTLLNTWYNDRNDPNSDSLAYGDGSDNQVLRGEVDTSTDATVTITRTLSTNHTIIRNFHSGSGFANPMTTAGDLILGGSGGAAGRLGIGANTYILTSNGTTASWQPATAGGLTSFTSPNSTINIGGTLTAPTADVNPGANIGWTVTQTFHSIIPAANTTYNLGSTSSGYWSNVYSSNFIAPGAAGLSSTGSNPVNLAINGTTKFAVLSSAELQAAGYGSGTNTGTAAYNISTDASGHFIETSLSPDVTTTVTTGTSSTVPNGTNSLVISLTAAGAYAVTLPTTWNANNDLWIRFVGNGTIASGSTMVTALTVIGGSGQTLDQLVAPTGAWSAGESIHYHLISGTIDHRDN